MIAAALLALLVPVLVLALAVTGRFAAAAAARHHPGQEGEAFDPEHGCLPLFWP